MSSVHEEASKEVLENVPVVEVEKTEEPQVVPENVQTEEPHTVLESVHVEVKKTEEPQVVPESVHVEVKKTEEPKAVPALEKAEEPDAVQRKLSHDPSVTIEYVVKNGGGDPEELRLSKELQQLVPGARADQIVRFLRARNGNLKAAAKMLNKTLEWRAENVGPTLLNPEEDNELKEELLKNKFCFFGTDKLGNKVLVLSIRFMGKHTYKDVEIAKRALFQMGEVMESRCEPLEKFTVLAANKDTASKHYDLDWLKIAGDFFQNNYPERLAQAISAPTPLFVRAVWSIAKYFFDPNTRAKVVLHARADAFLKFVEADQLPAELGGEATTPLSAEDMFLPVHVPATAEVAVEASEKIYAEGA